MQQEIGSVICGEVVEVTERGTVVSLPGGREGFVPVSESTPLERMRATLRAGSQVTAKIVQREADGKLVLSIDLSQQADVSDSFDKEFHRLNNVLTNRTSSFTLARAQTEGLVEERIEEWMSEADAGLARLHKHRSKRLSQGVYENSGKN